MPREERQRVVEFILDAERLEAAEKPAVRFADDGAFDSVVDSVFEKHAELFKKLAE